MLRLGLDAMKLLLSLMILGAGIVSGQDYPNKPIRIITGAAGGGNDEISRFIAAGITGPLGQPVIVENRGSVTISSELVANATPDGHTLLLAGSSVWRTPLLGTKVPYDVEKDFAPVSLVELVPSVLVVHPSLAVKSVKELISVAKAKPGALNYGSTGAGSTGWFCGELFKSIAGVNIVNVNYKVNAQATTAMLGGEVQMLFAAANVVTPFVKAGKLTALAVTSAKPTALAPGLPTMASSDLPGYELVSASGVWVTAKTPAAIINRLHRELVRFLNTAEAKEKFFSSGSEVVAGTPAEYAAVIKSDTARISKIIKDAGLKTQ